MQFIIKSKKDRSLKLKQTTPSRNWVGYESKFAGKRGEMARVNMAHIKTPTHSSSNKTHLASVKVFITNESWQGSRRSRPPVCDQD